MSFLNSDAKSNESKSCMRFNNDESPDTHFKGGENHHQNPPPPPINFFERGF